MAVFSFLASFFQELPRLSRAAKRMWGRLAATISRRPPAPSPAGRRHHLPPAAGTTSPLLLLVRAPLREATPRSDCRTGLSCQIEVIAPHQWDTDHLAVPKSKPTHLVDVTRRYIYLFGRKTRSFIAKIIDV
jgi:hypothetical protein